MFQTSDSTTGGYRMSSKAIMGFLLMVAAVVIGSFIATWIANWRAKQQEAA
jgi:hypothetical protein